MNKQTTNISQVVQAHSLLVNTNGTLPEALCNTLLMLQHWLTSCCPSNSPQWPYRSSHSSPVSPYTVCASTPQRKGQPFCAGMLGWMGRMWGMEQRRHALAFNVGLCNMAMSLQNRSHAFYWHHINTLRLQSSCGQLLLDERYQFNWIEVLCD